MKKLLSLVIIAGIVSSLFTGCSEGTSKKANTDTTVSKQEDSKEKDRSYTGTLKAITETKVIPKGKGQILEDYFNTGDRVNEGDLLFKLDDAALSDSLSTTRNSLTRANISISAAQENMSYLKVYAPKSGILHNFTLKSGERINSGKIADIVDEQSLVAKVPFNESQLSKVSVGAQALLTSSEFMTSTAGTVTRIYDSRETSIAGSILHNVEITANNPGGFKNGSAVSAAIETDSGRVTSPISGKIDSADSTPVISRGSGNVLNIYVKDGQWIQEGQLILDIENSSINQTLQRALLDKNDLDIKLKRMEQDYANLSITSPASGTITAKSKNRLDSISSNSESIMTISETSSLILKIDMDEEDAAKLKEGDSITVKLSDESTSSVEGKVTVISKTGKLTGTAKLYPVEITIDNKNNLIKPNLTATITIGGKEK